MPSEVPVCEPKKRNCGGGGVSKMNRVRLDLSGDWKLFLTVTREDWRNVYPNAASDYSQSEF